MRRTHRLRWQAAAVATVAAFTVAACSSSSSSSAGSGSSSSSSALTASAPGITPTQILIGSHQPLTGPAAPGYSEIAPASAAYFAYVNAHGGVYGRKIVYKYPRRRLQPDQDGVGRASAGAAGQRVRRVRRPRHAHAPGRGELPQRAEGAGRVRRVRVRVRERPDEVPGDVRLAARLHPGGEDPRPVREAALRGQEGRVLLPERRVRPGRGQGPARRAPGLDGGQQADLRPDQHQHRARRSPRCAHQAPRWSSRSPSRRSPRCSS